MLAGLLPTWRGKGWRRVALLPALLLVGGLTYMANFRMAADHMFLQPKALRMASVEGNEVALDRLVVGIDINGDARAYPIQFIGYHHQVRDTVGGEEVLISYCTVCRTARVFSPKVDGASETFRLVGMDHYNAMLEDKRTGSWWRQANGEAIVGKLKGRTLTEIPSVQVSLAEWLREHSDSRVMQADSASLARYSQGYGYESGTSRSALTGTDTGSWNEKSWVVGVTVDSSRKAFDWKRLRRERVVNDFVGPAPVVVVLRDDDKSFYAFVRPDSATRFTLRGDSLVAGPMAFSLQGRGATSSLMRAKASQEFWHSWRTFQPASERY